MFNCLLLRRESTSGCPPVADVPPAYSPESAEITSVQPLPYHFPNPHETHVAKVDTLEQTKNFRSSQTFPTFSASTNISWSLHHLVAHPSSDMPVAPTDGPSLWTQGPSARSGNTFTFDMARSAGTADILDDLHIAFAAAEGTCSLPAELNIAKIKFDVCSGSDYEREERTMADFTGAGLLCHNAVEDRRAYSHREKGQVTFLVPVVPFHRDGPCFMPLVLNNRLRLRLSITVEMARPVSELHLQFSGRNTLDWKAILSKATTKWETCDTFNLWQKLDGSSPISWTKCRTFPASLKSCETEISLNSFSQVDVGRQLLGFLVLHSVTLVSRIQLQINGKEVAPRMTLSGLYARTLAFERIPGCEGSGYHAGKGGDLYAIPLNGLCAQGLEDLRLLVTTEGVTEEPFTVYGRIIGGALPSDVTFIRALCSSPGAK
jgi:hypothetical protein